jgi:N-acetylglucosamine kinase-like BadF-type ATPase
MKVKLIADSGSTKADWKLISGSTEIKSFQTKGMNPYFRTREDVTQELSEKILPDITQEVSEIFFYGAGVVNQANIVKEALSRLFPAANVETHSDVLGASRALFGRNAGIACTLGTGSNACFYDGMNVAEKVPPLGFILGDECSGSAFGKKLLGDYFKRIMPSDLRILFEQEFSPVLVDVLDQVYRMERPNRYLAAFAPFLSAHIQELYCREMVEKSFKEFFERNVLTLPLASSHSIGFVGSVAHYFRDIVTEQTEAFGFKKPIILKEPVTGLVTYHKN